MCGELDEELNDGYKHAVALVDHLEKMGGASKATIPVLDRAQEYVVVVQTKAAHDLEQEQLRRYRNHD